MTTRATSTFTIVTWEATPYDERDGITPSRTHVVKTFQGDVEGHSTAELLMAGAREGSAAYVGFERIGGHVHGRAGSFLLHHSASMTRDAQAATWTIVPESGTGDLAGVRGIARVIAEPDGGHTFTLDDDLDG